MCQRESQLRRLMERDAAIYAERAEAMNELKSKEPAPKWNYLPAPDGLDRWPQKPSVSPYDPCEPYAIGRF